MTYLEDFFLQQQKTELKANGLFQLYVLILWNSLEQFGS